MSKKSVFSLVILAGSLTCAKPIRAQGLSLGQILNRASQTPDQKMIALNHKISEMESAMLYSYALPQIKFMTSASRSQQSSQTPPHHRNPNLPDHVYSSSYEFAIELGGPLYSFGRVSGLGEIYDLQNEYNKLSYRNNKEKFLLRVIEAYTRAYYALNEEFVAKETYFYADKLFRYAEVEFKRGGMSRVDYFRAKSFKTKAHTLWQQKIRMQVTSLARLKHVLGINQGEDLAISRNVDLNGSYFAVDLNAEREKPDFLKITKLKAKIARETEEYKASANLPELSYFAKIGANPIDMPTFGLEGEASDLGKNERLNLTVGIRLSWTLFDGFYGVSDYEKALAERELTAIGYKQKRVENLIRIKEFHDHLSIAKDMYAANTQQEEAEQMQFMKLDQDFKLGGTSFSDLLESEKKLADARLATKKTYIDIVKATAALKHELGQRIF